MPLQWQNIEIPIAGVDQYTDAPHVILTKMHTLENVRFFKPPSVSKRYGWTELAASTQTGASLDLPLRVAGFKKETLSMGASRLFAYSQSSSRWSERGNLSDWLLNQQKVFFDASRNVPEADSAVAGNCMVIVWGGVADTVQGAIIDLATESIVSTISLTGASGAVSQGQTRVIAIGAYIFILYHVTGGGSLAYVSMNTSSTWTFTSPLSIPLTGTVGTTPVWDATTLGTTKFLIGYRNSATSEPYIDLFTPTTGVLGGAPDATWHNDAAINIPDSANGGAVAIVGTTGERVYFTYNTDVPSTRRVLTTDALVETVAPGNLDATFAFTRMSMCRLNSTSVLFTFQHPVVAGFTNEHLRYGNLSNAGTVSLAQVQDAWTPASKPIMVSGSARQLLVYDSEEQSTYAFVELTDSSGAVRAPRWFGTYARSRAATEASNTCFLPNVNSYATLGSLEMSLGTKFQFRFAKTGDETATLSRAGICRASWNASSTHANQSAPWGDNLFIAGARPSLYDGNTVSEHGFSTYPERWTFDALHASGQLSAGDYSYVLVYEFTDNAGNVIRSAPSPVPANVTVAINQYFTVTLDETLLTARGVVAGYTSVFTSVRVIPYRTIVGPPVDAVYYRDSTLGFSATRGTLISIGFEFDDAELQLQEQLYTTGDILDNAGTPPLWDAHTHNNRLFACGAEERGWVWFSQPFQEGEEPRFNEALRIPMDDEVFALESLDENLIAFHRHGISAIVGDGPPATGGLDLGFGVVTVPSDVGCIVPESLLRTPAGLFFQSAKGIHLLKRDLSVAWVGAPIKRILETYTQVTGAALMSDSQEAVFFVRSLSASGRLIYNHELEQWSFDTCPLVATTGAAAYSNGRQSLVYGTTGTRFFVQGTSAATDAETATSYPAVKIRTPYVKLNTLQGWQAVRKFIVLAKKLGTHGVTISVDYDYEETFAETHTWTAAEITALTREQLEVSLTRHKCQAVAFQFLETNVTADGLYTASAGPEVISLVCEGGFKRGIQKTRDAVAHRK